MSMMFENAPIGVKVTVEIGFGAHHVGRKFSQSEVIEFSRKRGGWNIVPLHVFAAGKKVYVRMEGYRPSPFEMVANMRKYRDRPYSAMKFNCDDAAEVLAGNPPKSTQRDKGVAGGVIGGAIARSLFGAGPIGIIAGTVIGVTIGVAIANK